MPKTSSDQLLEEIGNDFITFLMTGVQLESFLQKIDSELNIDKIDKLLQIHFVLKDDVIEFINNLPRQIRRIKTTVEKKHEKVSNEIRGKIDWQRTLKSRYSTNPRDSSQFVITRVERNYNTTENIILKSLLEKIYHIVFHLLNQAIEGEYDWVADWIKDNNKLRSTVKKVYLRNIYMRRIELDHNLKITSRMVTDTLNSRNPLYREAAKLLQTYRKLMDYDIAPSEAKDLLKNTFIKPEKTEVLFELYWIFKIIKQLTKYKQVLFHLIEGGNNIVAEWEDEESKYRIYHDSTGSFSFFENWNNIELSGNDNYIEREAKVVKKWQSLGKKLLKQNFTDTLWGGRPDILVEKYNIENNKLQQIFIGEVKYTKSKGYIAQGLKELLEYMALIKDDKYIENIDSLFGVDDHENVKGALFIDKTSNINIANQQDKNVKIVMYDQDAMGSNKILNLINK